MALRKTAIAVPAELLDEIDRVAKSRGQSRNAFITHVLRAVLRARRDRDITRALDEVFSDPERVAEQKRGTEQLDDAGSAWNDERW